MTQAGGCLFQIGYYLYTRTRLGYYYHLKDIEKAREKLGDRGHSDLKDFKFGNLNIVPIPMLLDNYAYLVTDIKSNKSVIIDPGHAAAVQKVLIERNIEPEAVLVTHKHWDHSGGNSDLKQQFSDIPVYGGKIDDVPEATHTVSDNDVLEFGDLSFRAILTPGHTVGHIVFLLDGNKFGSEDCLFSGDCLFVGGIGRMFEGSPATTLNSLDRLMNLSSSTLLWPGHEYAKDNLEFAKHMEPENEDIQKKLDWVEEMREKNSITIPSSLAEEKLYNPFLRTTEMSILRRVGVVDVNEGQKAVDTEIKARVLGLVRKMKDNFKYKL